MRNIGATNGRSIRLGAAIGQPAFVTSTVFAIVGSPPRTFRQWVADHTDAFRNEV